MSKQGFGGDDDKDKNDIERLLEGFKSAKEWYENNQDLFARFSGGGPALDLSESEPVSEAHIKEDKVLIVADVSGASSTELAVKFYKNSLECSLGGKEFTVEVPPDVDEDSLEASMNNGVLRVELDRNTGGGDSVTVDSIEHTDDTIGDDSDRCPYDEDDGDSESEVEELFDEGEESLEEDDDDENSGESDGSTAKKWHNEEEGGDE